MGQVRKHLPVKMIAGFIFHDPEYFIAAKNILKRKFGEIDLQSDILQFIHTDYYKPELGEDLKRGFVSFRRLVRPQLLPQIKIFTNNIERRLSSGRRRRVNIDPGYLDLSKLILATTKDYSHRIYLDRDIFAEVTLCFQNRTFTPQAWTYADYKTGAYIKIFNQIREIYARQIDQFKPRGFPVILLPLLVFPATGCASVYNPATEKRKPFLSILPARIDNVKSEISGLEQEVR